MPKRAWRTSCATCRKVAQLLVWASSSASNSMLVCQPSQQYTQWESIMYVRRFSPDIKSKIPGGHPGLYGALILVNQASMPTDHAAIASFAERMHGMPLTIDAPLQVEAMYFEPHAR